MLLLFRNCACDSFKLFYTAHCSLTNDPSSFFTFTLFFCSPILLFFFYLFFPHFSLAPLVLLLLCLFSLPLFQLFFFFSSCAFFLSFTPLPFTPRIIFESTYLTKLRAPPDRRLRWNPLRGSIPFPIPPVLFPCFPLFLPFSDLLS